MLCLLLYHLLSRVFTLIEVIPESLEDGASCGGVAFEVVAVFHLLQLFLLVAAQCLWHIDADIHYHVSHRVEQSRYPRSIGEIDV